MSHFIHCYKSDEDTELQQFSGDYWEQHIQLSFLLLLNISSGEWGWGYFSSKNRGGICTLKSFLLWRKIVELMGVINWGQYLCSKRRLVCSLLSAKDVFAAVHLRVGFYKFFTKCSYVAFVLSTVHFKHLKFHNTSGAWTEQNEDCFGLAGY